MNSQEGTTVDQERIEAEQRAAAEAAEIKEIQYQRGLSDGREGLTPCSSSDDYWKGFEEGHRERFIREHFTTRLRPRGRQAVQEWLHQSS